ARVLAGGKDGEAVVDGGLAPERLTEPADVAIRGAEPYELGEGVLVVGGELEDLAEDPCGVLLLALGQQGRAENPASLHVAGVECECAVARLAGVPRLAEVQVGGADPRPDLGPRLGLFVEVLP